MSFSKEIQDKINKIKKFGINNLCIISDFDKTITTGIDKFGISQSCSFSVFSNNPHLLGMDYLKETNRLFDKYYTIEQSSDYKDLEKEKYMIEWWKKEFKLYEKYNFNNSIISNIIKNKLIKFKPVTNIFFKILNENKIPIIIFSAGIYNLINGFVKQTNNDYKNVHIVANQFKFDNSGSFIGTFGDVIHSLNKTFTELSHLPVYKDLKNKKTCILLGDSPSDPKCQMDQVLKLY